MLFNIFAWGVIVMNRLISLGTIIAVTLVFNLSPVVYAKSVDLDDFVFTSGPQGSGWYPFSISVSEIWMDQIDGLRVSIVEGAGMTNVERVDSGEESPIGIAYIPDCMAALKGDKPFDKKYENIRFITAMYPSWTTVAVSAASDVTSIEEIFSKHITPGDTNYASTNDFKRLLKYYDKDIEDVKEAGGNVSYGTYSDGANLLRDGIADVQIAHGAPEVVALSEIDAMNPIRILDLPDDFITEMKARGYVKGNIPAGTYRKQDKDVQTLKFYTCLIAHKDVPEKTVYELTKLLWDDDNLERLREEQGKRAKMMKIKNALGGVEKRDIDLFHSGARKYFNEVGVIK